MSFADDGRRRRVIIFGGTSGINLGVAKSFAASGAIVAVASRNPSKVDAAVGALKELVADALGFALDVREGRQLVSRRRANDRKRGRAGCGAGMKANGERVWESRLRAP